MQSCSEIHLWISLVCAMSPDSQSDALVAILLVTDSELQQTGASVSNFVR